jgi:hypothetical protein
LQEFIDEAHERAELEGLVPTHIRDIDLERIPPFPFPFIGDYIPEGWEQARDIDGDPVTLFCDSSGFGSESEPALTVKQLIGKLREYKRSGDSYGFAITQVGQFQVYVGVFKPDSRDFTHSGKLTRKELGQVL